MPIERYLRTVADTSSADLLTALRTVHIGIVGPSASGTPGTAVTYTSLNAALTGIGASTANGSYLPYMLKELYRVNDAQKVTVATTYNPATTATTSTSAGGLALGATVATPASVVGFATGDTVKFVDSSATPIEITRTITVSGSTFTFAALETALTGTVTYTKLTVPTTAQLAAARTALDAVTGIELYVEVTSDATQLTAIKTFLNNREAEDKFTMAIIGEPVGTTLPGATSGTVSRASAVNSKRLVYVAGDVTLKDSLVRAPVAAAILAAKLADMKGRQRVQGKAVLSMNDIPLLNISDYTAFSKADRTALTNGGATAFVNKTIAGTATFRVHQAVTTYKLDSLGNPSTIYANISDIMVEDLMRELVSTDFDAWSAELTELGDPLTTTTDDLSKIKAHVNAHISTFNFIDTDFKNRVEVTSPSTSAVQIKVIYKAVDVAHQIELVFVKNIRA